MAGIQLDPFKIIWLQRLFVFKFPAYWDRKRWVLLNLYSEHQVGIWSVYSAQTQRRCRAAACKCRTWYTSLNFYAAKWAMFYCSASWGKSWGRRSSCADSYESRSESRPSCKAKATSYILTSTLSHMIRAAAVQDLFCKELCFPGRVVWSNALNLYLLNPESACQPLVIGITSMLLRRPYGTESHLLLH